MGGKGWGVRKIWEMGSRRASRLLWRILPRDVRTEQLFAHSWVFRIKPLKIRLLAGEQKATEIKELGQTAGFSWWVGQGSASLVLGFSGCCLGPWVPFV